MILLMLVKIAPVVIRRIATTVVELISFLTPKNRVTIKTNSIKVLRIVRKIGIGIKERAFIPIPALITYKKE